MYLCKTLAAQSGALFRTASLNTKETKMKNEATGPVALTSCSVVWAMRWDLVTCGAFPTCVTETAAVPSWFPTASSSSSWASPSSSLTSAWANSPAAGHWLVGSFLPFSLVRRTRSTCTKLHFTVIISHCKSNLLLVFYMNARMQLILMNVLWKHFMNYYLLIYARSCWAPLTLWRVWEVNLNP